MTDIENEILNLINEVTESKYISGLIVNHDDDIWSLSLSMNQYLAPIILSYQGDYEAFKKFLQEEFKSRKMEKVRYWTGIQEIQLTEDQYTNVSNITDINTMR